MMREYLNEYLTWGNLLKRAGGVTGLEFSLNKGTNTLEVKYQNMWCYIGPTLADCGLEWEKIQKKKFIEGLDELKQNILDKTF